MSRMRRRASRADSRSLRIRYDATTCRHPISDHSSARACVRTLRTVADACRQHGFQDTEVRIGSWRGVDEARVRGGSSRERSMADGDVDRGRETVAEQPMRR
eukprot:2776999-Rhodomonas_salina.1